MLRKDYFLSAIKNNLYQEIGWLFNIFSISDNKPEKDLKPFDIIRSHTGVEFINPNDPSGKTRITDAVPNQPLFQMKEKIELKKGDLENVYQDIITTYGNVIFNVCTLIYGFKHKVPFVTGLVNIKDIEKYIVKRLKDTPEDDNLRKDNELYCDEYVRFGDGLQYLTELNNMCVWGVTEKTLTPPPNIKEIKKQLLEKYKDQLHDPVIIAKIYDELLKVDKEYLKDDPGNNFLISGKLRNVVRRKLYLIQGAEAGLGNTNELDLVGQSLGEGWEIDKFATYNNVSRAGSFDRGSETQLGGVSTKEILRATSNIRIVKGDCGTKLGLELKVDKNNYKTLVDLRVIEGLESKLIENEEQAGTYIGKTIQKRSPQFCKLEKTDFCEYCVGKRLADTETGASMAATELGGVFLGIFMSSMHAKELKVNELDIETAFS